jgi:hypothetical protein
MKWSNPPTSTPILVDGAISDLRAELEGTLVLVEQLRDRLMAALKRLP